METVLSDGFFFEKKGDEYFVNGKDGFDALSLLSALSDADDYEMTAPLKKETAEYYKSLYSGLFNVPDFDRMLFPPLASSLLDYLSKEKDEELLASLTKSFGIRNAEENEAEVARRAMEELSYKAYWRAFSEALLTRKDFLSFRFSPLKPFADGAFLYDDEKVWAYVIISREGREKRNATVALQLLSDEYAVSDAEEALSLSWCRHFEKNGVTSFSFGTVKNTENGEETLYKRFYLEFDSPLEAEELASAIAEYKKATEVFPL